MIGSTKIQVEDPPTSQISSVIGHRLQPTSDTKSNVISEFCSVPSDIVSTASSGCSAVVPVSARICQAWACNLASSDIQDEGTGRREAGHQGGD